MSGNDKEIGKLFHSTGDWQHNACFNAAPDSFELYVHGYKIAGDLLAAQAIETRHNQDFLIYPIDFLYRHYIELRLKKIIRDGSILLDKDGNFPTHHKIQELWSIAKEIALQVFKNDNDQLELQYVDRVISEFASLDPGSLTFRYPIDKDGKNVLEGVAHINIRHFAEVIDKLANDLDGIANGILVHQEWKQAMLSEIS